MKILLLSDLNSVHTQRWASALAQRGLEIHVVGLVPLKKSTTYFSNPLIKTYHLLDNKLDQSGILAKFSYVKGLPRLKKIYQEIRPDIVHAHFASSYGLLGALLNKHPYYISLWGDDVLIFPFQSFLKRKIIQFNFNRADLLLSTSEAMTKAAKQLTDKEVVLTYFGVDLNQFVPRKTAKNLEIVVGTIKGLETIYGVDILIKAFAKVVLRHPELKLKLLIVGGGSEESSLKQMAHDLIQTAEVEFTGKIDHELVPSFHQKIDVFVALSRSESFGVSVVEAMATKVPCVVTNVGGFPEVVQDKITGFIVPSEDVHEASLAIEKLVANEDLRIKMGELGRKRVEEKFDWKKNVDLMMSQYKKVKAV